MLRRELIDTETLQSSLNNINPSKRRKIIKGVSVELHRNKIMRKSHEKTKKCYTLLLIYKSNFVLNIKEIKNMRINKILGVIV